jgi:hypothetical protein
LVAGFGNPVAADYLDYATRTGDQDAAMFSRAALQVIASRGRIAALVLFVNPRLSEQDRSTVDDMLRLAGECDTEFVSVVSSFRADLGDPSAAEAETHVVARARRLNARVVVFRPGHVLSPRSPISAWLRRLGACYPLVPSRMHSCFIEGNELFRAIESERQSSGRPRTQCFSLFGPNRSLRDCLAQHCGSGILNGCLKAISGLLSLLLVGHLAALAFDLMAWCWPSLRRWNFDTLRPRSLGELLALYNKYNYRHVKVVGYNNGVTHFGHRYPGKTIISTVLCNRVGLAGGGVLKADCGVTVRQALDFLAGSDHTLPVVPNYSYVCLGTSLFVPIHGSAADFSTVADTITRIVLYDPVRDRVIAAERGDPAFRAQVYNQRADALLLRLYLRVKPRAAYYVHKQTLPEPTGEELVSALRDDRATNVEIRKSRGSSKTVTISRYYTNPGDTQSAVLELPRDGLGRLWDRLEENPVTSFLMHALTRHFAWHVELFFTADEFATFWRSHAALPLRKIQVRYIRRDGLPHSPFREHDCVSVDLFMLRRHRGPFEAYLQRTFPVVRTNPGKHSR